MREDPRKLCWHNHQARKVRYQIRKPKGEGWKVEDPEPSCCSTAHEVFLVWRRYYRQAEARNRYWDRRMDRV